MIVMDEGCYEYHLNHQDEMDAENDMTRPTLEASSDIFIKNIFLEKKPPLQQSPEIYLIKKTHDIKQTIITKHFSVPYFICP